MKEYTVTGFVYGKCWGSGFAAYPSKRICGNSKEGVLQEAQKMLNDRSLDSGMGFESLKGALLNIEEVETIEVNGKGYTRSEFDTEFIGNLTEEEQDFLLECQYSV